MKSTIRTISASWLATCAYVGAVTCYDVYTSTAMGEHLAKVEVNPIGRWLIEINNGSIELFMFVKIAALVVIVLSVTLLQQLRHWTYPWMVYVLWFYYTLLLGWIMAVESINSKDYYPIL